MFRIAVGRPAGSWHSIICNNAAFSLKTCNLASFRRGELQPYADAAAILRDEHGSKFLKSSLQGLEIPLVRVVDLALEVMDCVFKHSRTKAELGAGDFHQGAGGSALRT